MTGLLVVRRDTRRWGGKERDAGTAASESPSPSALQIGVKATKKLALTLGESFLFPFSDRRIARSPGERSRKWRRRRRGLPPSLPPAATSGKQAKPSSLPPSLSPYRRRRQNSFHASLLGETTRRRKAALASREEEGLFIWCHAEGT